MAGPITMDCPQCKTASSAVGNPQPQKPGWAGSWYCFNCGSSGGWVVQFTITKVGP